MINSSPRDFLARPLVVWSTGLAGILGIGVFDYFSGTELRVYPLYYAPVGLLAWHVGNRGAIVGAVGAALCWVTFNFMAGMRFTHDSMWVVNTAMHGASFLFVGSLIARLRQTVVRMHDLSRTDTLTGLRNSRAFYEDTGPLLALCRRNGRPVTVAYVDLDHFKAVNDRHGHQSGDALLRAAAQAIQRCVRPSDLAARLGGDEFVVLLPELDDAAARSTLERLRTALSEAGTGDIRVSASIGGVTLQPAPDDVEAIVRRADAEMYKAKASGRNAVRLESLGRHTGEMA